ncbi:unnamed protein product [Arabidopsis halleri]
MFLFRFILLGVLHVASAFSERSSYVVHTAATTMTSAEKFKWYESSVKSISASGEVLYKYNHAINGFSARLTPEEVELLSGKPGILAVVPEVVYKLETTRTPTFLGLGDNVDGEDLRHNGSASDVIVGVIDSGIWPESKSFNDIGFGPVPISWKGECEEGMNFTASLCNRKLIGARFFLKGFEAEMVQSDDFRSPRDSLGHGTHTSSIAAGSAVKGAAFLGYAAGVARGMAPLARIAMYKACWLGGFCVSSDVLAAIDKAIEDNVNILSLSLALNRLDYDKDSIAIGALAATEHGVFVAAAGGNDGPRSSSLANVAPWLTTVGAGTLDRKFPATIILGNGKVFPGESLLFQGNGLPDEMLPIVYHRFGKEVEGSIVLDDLRFYDNEVRQSKNGKEPLGMIYANMVFDGTELVATYAQSPSAVVGKEIGDEIRHYVITESNPTATIKFNGTVIDYKPSPMVAGFSSRGPNSITPEILKPDLIAPGVNILAAWIGVKGPDSEFNIESGTSMACPHVSGIAALLKAAHPEWSPAAIRSAMMTTAKTSSNDGKPILDSATGKPSTPFAHGAGHVSPVSAFKPGLIYDLTAMDYLHFLCASNYTSSQIKIITRSEFSCDRSKEYRISELNYPSFAVTINRGGGGAYTYTRIVTSVGGAGTYTVKVMSDVKAVNISVEPAVLDFNNVNEKKSYSVFFTVNPSMPSGTSSFGSIEWSDGKHLVRSPVALTWT